MYQRLATLIATTGLTAGIALLLTFATLMPGATHAAAAECPQGTAPIIDIGGVTQCAPSGVGETTSEPTSAPIPAPTPPPTPAATPAPTNLPAPPEEPTTPPAEPTPSAVPESSPAAIVPPPVAALIPPETPLAATVAPAPALTPTPVERTQTPQEPAASSTPTPAAVPPDPPVNSDLSGAIVPGDGPRLLWAVAAGASASGLLATLVAFYLVSVRPFFIARRRPSALG